MARDLGLGSLLAIRDGSVVLLAQHDRSWEGLRAAVVAEIGGSCRVGVGGAYASPNDLLRSHREALAAIRLQRATTADRTTVFDELGVYRLFASIEDIDAVEEYVTELLGDLQSYDARRGSELVRTLTCYLDAGGRHESAAAALSVHPSTLKYRLQRIREISGHELLDPGTQFELHLATRAWQTLIALRAVQ
jgi:DNA-binding PucR family transcriptional regulator